MYSMTRENYYLRKKNVADKVIIWIVRGLILITRYTKFKVSENKNKKKVSNLENYTGDDEETKRCELISL